MSTNKQPVIIKKGGAPLPPRPKDTPPPKKVDK